MTLLVQAAEIAHTYGGHQLFDDVGFELREGDRFALIGANGAGKSTLFRIMARDVTPVRGTITYRRGVRVGFLTQASTLDPAATVRDVVALAAGDAHALEQRLQQLERAMASDLSDDALTAVMDEYGEVLARLEAGEGTTGSDSPGFRVLSGLHVPEQLWDAAIGTLSGGEKKLVALARLLVEAPEVLLLDEPDNHLDLEAKSWLERHLSERSGAVAVISHDRYFIDRVANRIFELEDGRIEVYPGNYTAFVEERRRRRERAQQLRDLDEREYKKLKASAEQLTQWARQNPKFAPRAENQRRKMEEERLRLDSAPVARLDRRQIDVEFDARRGGTMVIEGQGLEKRFGARQIVQPFDLIVRHGERVGLVGPNGAGKTTLFRLLLGIEPPSGGSVRIGAAIQPGYYAQEHETLNPRQTPMEFVRARKPFTEQQAIGCLNGLLFTRHQMLNPIEFLSGGEKARLQVAGLILEGANLLMLDEPTNNLDLGSIEALERALADFGGTMIAISHDRFFLDTVCYRTLEIRDGVVRDYAGGFGFYEAHPELGTVLTRQSAPPAVSVKRR